MGLPQEYKNLQNIPPFTLHPLTLAAIDDLDSWIRKKYVRQVYETVSELPDREKQEFVRESLTTALALSSQFGEGRTLLLGNAYGMLRYVYAHIKSPAFSFEQFHSAVFPNDELTETGMEKVYELITAVHPEANDPKTETKTTLKK